MQRSSEVTTVKPEEFWFDELGEPKEKITSRTVVRLKTSIWFDGKGLHCKKSIQLLKRKSTGDYHPFFDEESADIQWGCILQNMYALKDGIYEIETIGTDYNWEYCVFESTGYMFEEYKEVDYV